MTDVSTKYVWVKLLKNEKGKTVLNSFIKKISKFKRKPNKLWVDQGREIYNKLMQKWFDDNDILMCSTYLDYLDKLVDEYNNTYHRSIGKKSIDADYSALTEEIETNPKAPKFKVRDRVRITKY